MNLAQMVRQGLRRIRQPAQTPLQQTPPAQATPERVGRYSVDYITAIPPLFYGSHTLVREELVYASGANEREIRENIKEAALKRATQLADTHRSNIVAVPYRKFIWDNPEAYVLFYGGTRN